MIRAKILSFFMTSNKVALSAPAKHGILLRVLYQKKPLGSQHLIFVTIRGLQVTLVTNIQETHFSMWVCSDVRERFVRHRPFVREFKECFYHHCLLRYKLK